VRVAVFGLGYVGCVTAAGLASRGHHVTGVDVTESKVAAINAGESPVIEPGLVDLIKTQVEAERLHAVTDGEAAVTDADVILICVGTPSARNGSLGTAAVLRVAATVGRALAPPVRRRRQVVVIRSTVLPGTCEELILPAIAANSGLLPGLDFGFAVNPEFLREGSSLDDFANPVKTVIGEYDQASGDVIERLYSGATGVVIRTSVRSAELAKYVDNAYHALKISFANEIGAICQAFDLDSHEVLRGFFADTKLNISAAYLQPGYAFGGSCLPKDLRALLYAARRRDVELPLLENILVSNEKVVARVVETVVALGHRRIGVFGLTFKSGTDDLRDSPYVELSERLLGKGFDLRIYDPAVSMARLVGANREFIDERIPHLSRLLAETAEEVFGHGDVCIVAGTAGDTIRALAASNGRVIVDLVRLPDAAERRGDPAYVGVAW
jgi:GDP-mannose 6-dehydrogenase